MAFVPNSLNNWCFTLLIRKKTGDKKTDNAASKFFKETMNFYKDTRRSYRETSEAMRRIMGVSSAAGESALSGMLDDTVKYRYVQTSNEHRLYFFGNYYMLDEILADSGELPFSELTEMGLSPGDVVHMTPELENKMKANRLPFPAPIGNYFKILGVYDACVEIQNNENRENLGFANAVDAVYNSLPENIKNALTLRNVISIGSNIAVSGTEQPEGEVTDSSVFKEAPDKRWYISANSLYVDDGSSKTKSLRKCVSFDEVFVMADEILKAVERVGNALTENMNVSQEKLEKEPERSLVFINMNGEPVPLNMLFAFSEDFELVEIPLTSKGAETPMHITKYYNYSDSK